MKKDIQFAEVIRFLGVILILLCHYTEQSVNVLLNMSAQFLNIGVSIFIILSGFLFGVREGGKNALSWYIRRIKRIYIPYVSVGRFSPFRVGLKTPISVNLKSPMHHVCY